MGPMNPMGDPRSYLGWSVWRPMHSLCFAKNISEENWTDNSVDALISYPWFSTRLQYLRCVAVLHETIGMSVCTCVWIRREYRLARFDKFFNWFYGLSISLTDHPELRRTTQRSIMGGPLGDPGFCFFRSTVNIHFCYAWSFTGSYCNTENGLFQANWVNIMSADGLGPNSI